MTGSATRLLDANMAQKRGVTWRQVIEMAAGYPGVVAKSSYGTPGLYVGKQFMARLRERPRVGRDGAEAGVR